MLGNTHIGPSSETKRAEGESGTENSEGLLRPFRPRRLREAHFREDRKAEGAASRPMNTEETAEDPVQMLHAYDTCSSSTAETKGPRSDKRNSGTCAEDKFKTRSEETLVSFGLLTDVTAFHLTEEGGY
ncbi:hypothetical protein TREES_T100002776 [Tupaia chinensis]|uniref:Uncharacterized protein n=1 Tax=Tupaia chinensis TaxID=246437 RepID=L9KYF7_TUPCH|nr:hypothetical protein TREES_T100002776 [Tupaia chinensis]